MYDFFFPVQLSESFASTHRLFGAYGGFQILPADLLCASYSPSEVSRAVAPAKDTHKH